MATATSTFSNGGTWGLQIDYTTGYGTFKINQILGYRSNYQTSGQTVNMGIYTNSGTANTSQTDVVTAYFACGSYGGSSYWKFNGSNCNHTQVTGISVKTLTVTINLINGASVNSYVGNNRKFTYTITMPVYYVYYNANGGSNPPSTQEKIPNATLTLTSSKPTVPASSTSNNYTVTFEGLGGTPSSNSLTSTKTISYSFKNWNTNSGGTGTTYNSGANYTANSGTTLYAQWNSTTTNNAITLPTCVHGDSYDYRDVTINANGGSSTIPSRTSEMTISYTMEGWYDDEDAGNKLGNAGASYTPTANGIAYAHYTNSFSNWTSITLPTASECTRTDYTLLGFDENSSATTPTYSPGETFTPSGDMQLYAIWEANQAKAYIKINGAWTEGFVWIKDNGTWKEAKQIYRKDNGSW